MAGDIAAERKRLKIAIDYRLADEPGTSNRTYWEGLVNGLLRLENRDLFELILLTNGPSPKSEALAIQGLCRHFASKRMHGKLWSIFWLPKACLTVGADLIHVQYTISPFMRTPAVTTIHDVSFFVCPEWFSKRDSVQLKTSVPMAAKKARRVITVSEHAKSEIVRFTGTPPEKISVTPLAAQNGIHRVEDHSVISEVLARLGVQTPFLLSVGTLQRRKNWKLVLESFALARKRIPNLQLVITGPCRIDASELHSFSESLGTNNALVLAGSVSYADLAALYSEAKLLLHPSFYEGFGLTPLEAMCCGCPVVASNTSSIPEVVQTFGRLIDGFEPTVWADSIVSTIGAAPASIDRAIAHAETFTWKRTAKLTAQAYLEAIGR